MFCEHYLRAEGRLQQKPSWNRKELRGTARETTSTSQILPLSKDWSETLGLNLVAHPVPAAHWYHFFG